MLTRSKTIFSTPKFLEKPYGWVQHIPFAFYLMETLRPEIFTELGTHTGNSYFSFCQAADELKLNTKCYAVDTWEGDEHSGVYGEEVYDRVRKINTQHFSHLSYLLKMKFDDALSYFSDGSIDLLHIDGLHTYEAVKHDFESWLPKMSKKGVVILHDTNVRNRGFGVWKLFEEVKDMYPSFEFLHSHGLGVLCVGQEVDKHFLGFVEIAKKDSYITNYFASLGQRVFVMQESQDIRQDLQKTKKTLRQSIKESDSVKQKVADLQQSVKNKQEEIKSFSARVNKSVENAGRQRDLNETLNLEMDQLRGEVAKKMVTISSLEATGAELKVMIGIEKEKLAEQSKQLDEYKALIKERDTQIGQLREELGKTHQELRKMRDDLFERQEKVLSKEFEVKELRQSLTSEQGRLNSLDKRNKDLQKSYSNLEELNLVLRETKDELRLLLIEREEQMQRLTAKNNELSSLLTEAERKAEVYKREIKNQGDELEGLQNKLSEKNQELLDVKKLAAASKHQATKDRETSELRKKQLESSNEKISQLNENLASAKARIEQGDKKYATLVDDLHRVKMANQNIKQQLRAKENALQAIVGSTSWRITKPVRYLGNLKRKIGAKPLFLLRILLYIITFRFNKVRREFRYARYRKVINRSGMFEREWYLETYPDVRKAGADPINHYVRRGASERRDPSPEFNTKAYLDYNKDVIDSGMNPLVHYIMFGKKEGRLSFQSNKKISTQVNKPNKKNNEPEGEYPYQISEPELLERVRAYNKQKKTRKATVVVYTAIIGNYDHLILPETIVDEWDYVLFADQKVIGEHIFEQRILPHYHKDPVRIARYVKTHPHIYFSEYEYAVWVDSNILIRGNHLYNQVKKSQANKILVMANPHPDRTTIDEELEKCILIKKDDPAIMKKQVERYKSEGYKSDNGLFETGISIRRINNDKVIHLNQIWWQEIQSGSRRDQLSFTYSLWKAGIAPEIFPNMKNLRIHENNDYCLFNHLKNKRNKNVPLYKTPSFLNKKAEERVAEPSHIVRFKHIIKRLRRNLLEAGFTDRAYKDLNAIFHYGSEKTIRSLAAWELVLWHANKKTRKDAQKALQYLKHIEVDTPIAQELEQKISIIKTECYLLLDQVDLAKNVIMNALEKKEDADLLLAAANCETKITSKLQMINKSLSREGFASISLLENKTNNFLLNIFSKGGKLDLSNDHTNLPTVSIIIPSYNASASIEMVLRSISAQTYSNLEIIVVDDNSTDNTVTIVEKYAKNDTRVRLLRLKKNMGPYFARNVGLKSATGDLITCNDTDDWSHPQKIEAQVLQFIRNPNLIASISQWVRVSEKMVFERRNNPGFYIQLNISSLMFNKKEVLDKVGYWDTVRFGADTEFYKRILNVFGTDSVSVLPATPLSFAHFSEDTLTGNAIYGYPGYPVGARKEYKDSYEHYHATTNMLRYEFPLKKRPFTVPDLMNPCKQTNTDFEKKIDIVIVSDFRIPDRNLIRYLTRVKSANPKIKIGLFQYEVYDLEINNLIDPNVREVTDGEQIKLLVYGENVSCNELIVWHIQSLLHKKANTPAIRPSKVKVLIQNLSLGAEVKTVFNLIKQCSKNAKLFFGKDAELYPATKSIRDSLTKNDGINGVFNFAPENWTNIHPEPWEQVSFSLKPIYKKYLSNKVGNPAVMNNYDKNVMLFDVNSMDKSLACVSEEIVVVMPCIDKNLGLETARFLEHRAAIECKIAVVYDSQRLGFIHVVNKVAESLKSKYIVYLAQDAFPGRDWLKLAYESLETTGKGLLGFNDGKWKGRIASFGIINVSWAKNLYNGNVFCSEYKSHKADNELTVIARAQNMYIFDPNIVLIEVDKNKDKHGSNPNDDSVFSKRFLNGFDGLISESDIQMFAKEYKIKLPDTH